MKDFDFPRDPNSAFFHITTDAIRDAVMTLAEGTDTRRYEVRNRYFQAMVEGKGGWDIVEMLKLGAVSAFMKGIDDTDYNAALVKQALVDYGWHVDPANSLSR